MRSLKSITTEELANFREKKRSHCHLEHCCKQQSANTKHDNTNYDLNIALGSSDQPIKDNNYMFVATKIH